MLGRMQAPCQSGLEVKGGRPPRPATFPKGYAESRNGFSFVARLG